MKCRDICTLCKGSLALREWHIIFQGSLNFYDVRISSCYLIWEKIFPVILQNLIYEIGTWCWQENNSFPFLNRSRHWCNAKHLWASPTTLFQQDYHVPTNEPIGSITHGSSYVCDKCGVTHRTSGQAKRCCRWLEHHTPEGSTVWNLRIALTVKNVNKMTWGKSICWLF